MEQILFPDWILFGGVFVFLKIYSPTAMYLDNIAIAAISVFLAMFIEYLGAEPSYVWVGAAIVFALFASVPYWLSGMVGGFAQQVLLLNEQSVQDKRFTTESEALPQLFSAIFLVYALESGFLFRPIFELLNGDIIGWTEGWVQNLYVFLAESMRVLSVVAGKYLIVILALTVTLSMVDVFFKNASFSISIATDLKGILIIIMLNYWFFSDQFYVFETMMSNLNYE